MENIKIYWGADSDFEVQIDSLNGNHTTLSEIFSHLDKKPPLLAIKNDKIDTSIEPPYDVENLVIFTDDYGQISEWALLSFSNSVLKNSKLAINNVWLNNPPSRLYDGIKKVFSNDIIHENPPKYREFELGNLKNIATNFNNFVIGQDDVIIKLLSSIYSLKNIKRKKPVSVLFLGDSGVGKTETAKYISTFADDKMLRIQFSMQQTAEAFNYIFGAKHGEACLGRDLIRRESNVILFDEFDKVPPSLHNAFYQMFDEGVFVESSYSVNLEKSIILCTTNYMSEQEAENKLGSPIFSRFSKVIVFKPISVENKKVVAKKNYDEIFDQLDDEDKILIENNGILEFYYGKITQGYYKNMRMLKNDIEDAVNYEVLKARNII